MRLKKRDRKEQLKLRKRRNKQLFRCSRQKRKTQTDANSAKKVELSPASKVVRNVADSFTSTASALKKKKDRRNSTSAMDASNTYFKERKRLEEVERKSRETIH